MFCVFDVRVVNSMPMLCFEINALCFQCVSCAFDLCVVFCDMSVLSVTLMGHRRHTMDERLCLRHKEHDFVWIDSLQHWKKDI